MRSAGTACSDALQHVTEDWHAALAVVAHPDDLEFGAAAAIARWTGQGKDVRYALVTSGEAGIGSLEPAAARVVREREQCAAAEIVGVRSVEFLGLQDGVLEYGVALRRLLAATIRRHRPEIVLTNNLRETWNGVSLNQPDHIATGRAVLDAVRDAGNRWIFPGEGGEPWAGVRQVWTITSPQSTHGVDVTETFPLGAASLRAHEQYLRGLNWPVADAESFLVRLAETTGERLGCPKAVSFEVFRLRE